MCHIGLYPGTREADARGDIALFEMGHRNYAILNSEAGLLINTNHFNSPAMRPFFVDTGPEPLQGNTYRRFDAVAAALSRASGQIDVSLAQGLMARHDSPLGAICRHPVGGMNTSTMSTMIFLPARQQMYFCYGQPCTGQYQLFASPPRPVGTI